MQRHGIVVGVLTLVLALPVLAAEPTLADSAGISYVLPSCANASGLFGAYYKTRLTLLNLNGGALALLFYLLSPSGPLRPVSYTVPATSSVTFDNALQDLFSYTGGGGLVIYTDPSTPNRGDQFVVSAPVNVERGSISWVATGSITYCYAVNVNDTSNDGTLLPPIAVTTNSR